MSSDWVQKKRIRFKDCDPLGHLFNTRYLEYLLESREDMLMEVYHFNLYEYMVERGHAWVIVRHEIAYLAEAMRNECVIMRSYLIDYDPKKIKVEYQMWMKP
jgi:YbgC/YbaW family acyl-CoA thioester hydrolase